MDKLFDRLNSFAAFKVAVLGAFLGHILDLASSELCFWTGAGFEANRFLANPEGGIFLVKAALVKLIAIALAAAIPAYFLRKWSKAWLLASLPFIIEGLRVFASVDVSNMEIFFLHVLRSLHV